MKTLIFLIGLALAIPAAAQTAPAERSDVVPWKLLAQVDLVKMKDRYGPKFSAGVTALDQQEVKIQGFMLPLENSQQQTHFVLTAAPPTCAFCLPGGPEQFVEVKAKKPVKYGFEPVVMTGKLTLLKDDPTGAFYRLTEAVPAD